MNELTPQVKTAIVQGLEEGLNSARSISMKLIDDKLVADEKFSTGKPCVYPFVCMYLEELRLQGRVILIWSTHQRDRAYRLCTEESLPSVVSEIQDAG